MAPFKDSDRKLPTCGVCAISGGMGTPSQTPRRNLSACGGACEPPTAACHRAYAAVTPVIGLAPGAPRTGRHRFRHTPPLCRRIIGGRFRRAAGFGTVAGLCGPSPFYLVDIAGAGYRTPDGCGPHASSNRRANSDRQTKDARHESCDEPRASENASRRASTYRPASSLVLSGLQAGPGFRRHRPGSRSLIRS